jgi:spore photoproduct lyase
MALNQSNHKTVLIRILKDIFSDPVVGPILGFKGGTAAYLFYSLNRFSVDLNFDLLDLTKKDLVFEIGSNSDLVLENTITQNLEWTIEEFGKSKKGFLTFPTKFDMVEPLLPLSHRGRVIPRMSVNPHEIIRRVDFGTSSLASRIDALNRMSDAGYKVGLLIAPVVLVDNWQELYKGLIEQLSEQISEKAKKQLFIEIIFMTYSYVHRAINREAFPNAIELFDKALMTGRGRGKYCYRENVRAAGEQFLREQLSKKLNNVPIIYVV